MPQKNLHKFFLSIVAPSILAILLFIISYFAIIIPQFEKNLMEAKKATIKELTNSAWSIIYENYSYYTDSILSLSEAREKAALQIEQMRYGAERKDYFWIIDMQPKMIMHPYRKELIGKDLSNYTDSHEKRLFVDAVKVAETSNEGFIDYYWQWKDDTSRVVPKLSYVKVFNQWNWIVGTGIYLDDVRDEIDTLKGRLFAISGFIISIIVFALFYIIRQSLRIELNRRNAEQNLRISRQKYKSLVEASKDGTLMISNDEIIYTNQKFLNILSSSYIDISELNFDEIFNLKWDAIKHDILDNKTQSFDCSMQAHSGKKDVLLSVSKVDYAGAVGFIIIVKDVTAQKRLTKESQDLSVEMQASLLLMNQPITSFIKTPISCSLTSTANEVALLMRRKKQKIIFVKNEHNIIGAINDSDLRNRVLAEKLSFNTTAANIMSAPVASIPDSAMIYQAVLSFWNKRVSHLLVKNANGKPLGVISNQDILEGQRNSISYLIKEIESSNQIEELAGLHKRLPALIHALIESGDKAENLTFITSSVSDAITKKVIELSLESLGKPPVDFAFIAMGSEGRHEETLLTDQDNAIVFSNHGDENENQTFFLDLAEKINTSLHQIGYNYCKGNIMARNPKWCQNVNTWKAYFSKWTNEPDPQNVLESCIFFDFRCVFGNTELTNELSQYVWNETHKNGLYFHHLAESITSFKPDISNENIDLKRLIFPIVAGIRTYALFEKINETNTLKRAAALKENNKIALQYNDLKQVYMFLMRLRFTTQSKAINNNLMLDNFIDTSEFSHVEITNLKEAQNQINFLITKLKQDFGNF